MKNIEAIRSSVTGIKGECYLKNYYQTKNPKAVEVTMVMYCDSKEIRKWIEEFSLNTPILNVELKK